jgi:hypothetical protein
MKHPPQARSDDDTRFLFAFTHLLLWQPLDPIARELRAKGQAVRLLLDRRRNRSFASRFEIARDAVPYEMGWMSGRRDFWQLFLPRVREYINYLAYLKVRQPTSDVLLERWSDYLLRPVRWMMKVGLLRQWLTSDALWRRLLRIEPVVPASRAIVRELTEFAPSVVIAGSGVMPFSKEIEYVKAARACGVPSIVIIPSWDNLTTKGTLQVVPDWLFVWNRGQVGEATRLHGIPEERIFCTGAPKFDPWFTLQPTVDRKQFCSEIGLDPEQPYLLYICSSEFIAGDETRFVEELAEALAAHPELRSLKLLVRPHPQNLKHWADHAPRNANTVLWRKDLRVMGTAGVRQEFHHSLHYSVGVAGINTSAFIESAIVDKPCIAIASDHYASTQWTIPHFKHLLDAGFLELPRDLGQAADAVARLLKGEDRKRDERRAFVRDFIRPHGIDLAASDVMAWAIENVARGHAPSGGPRSLQGRGSASA